MTAKEQTREILRTLQTKTVVIKPHESYMALVDDALSQIEEIVMEVIGKQELQGMKTPLQWEVAQDRNYLRKEQLKRWSDTIKP